MNNGLVKGVRMNNDNGAFLNFTEQFRKAVDQSESFLIMPHVNMDGDALGSALAIYQVLKIMGKDPVIYTTDQVAGAYQFLPGLQNLTEKLPDRKFDCAIMVECPNYSRCPAGDNFRARIQINVDHHPDNTFYGDINYVDIEASSVGEIFFELFEALGYYMSKDTVLGLYVAIFTDTGAFQYSKTSHRTHMVISKMLQRYNLPLEEIGRRVYREMDHNVMQLLGQLMLDTKVYRREGIALALLPRDMMDKYRVKEADAQNIIRDLNVIRGVHTIIFIRELKDGKAKASIRSSKIPVNGIAARFNGGGHERAAGCKLDMPLDQAGDTLVEAVRETIA